MDYVHFDVLNFEYRGANNSVILQVWFLKIN